MTKRIDRSVLCYRILLKVVWCIPLLMFGIPGQQLAAETIVEGGIEEIVVTATRRAQSIDEVPIAVSVYTGDTLKALGVREINDLGHVSPSISFAQTTSESTGSQVRIRGIGTSGTNPGLEPSVGIVMDGVFRSRTGLGMGDLLDVESVEILRGPQGTLFGKNTSAGVIQIATAKPSYDFGGYVDVGLEDYDGYSATVGVTGPIADDRLAFRLAARIHDRDGFVEDRFRSADFYDRDRLSVKGQLLWDVTEDFDIRVIADYKKREESCCIADYTVLGPTAPVITALGGGTLRVDPFSYETQTSFDSSDDQDELGMSVEANWLWGDVRATYIGAWRSTEIFQNLDVDTSRIDLLNPVDWEQESDNQSHEFRFNGEAGRLNWLVGAFYYQEDTEVDWRVTYGADFGTYFSLLLGGLLPPALLPEDAGDTNRNFEQEAQGWALFTHNIISLSESNDLTIGVRWSQDDKDARSIITNNAIHCAVAPFVPFCPVPGIDGDRQEEELSGTISFLHRISHGSLYASYSRGYKAGGFNLDRDAAVFTEQFEPETGDNYELGAKLRNESGTFQINTALFYSTYEEFQLNEFNGVTFVITNAGKVTSKGAEIETMWLPNEQWNVTFGATFTDTEFKKHPGFNNVGESLEGKEIPYATDWALSGSVGYELPINQVAIYGLLSARYTGDHFVDTSLDPETEQSGYTLTNFRIGVKSLSERWDFSLWATNLLNEEYHVSIVDAALQNGSFAGFWGEPRMFGGTLRVNF